MYLYIHVYILHYIYQPPANAAGLSWAWDCKQHGQKHHQSSSSTSSSNNSTILSIASSMARSTTKSNSNNNNSNNNNNNSNNDNNNNKKKKKNNKNKNKNNSNSNSNKSSSSSSSGNRRKPTRTAAPQRTQGESSPRPFGCGVVVVVLVLVVLVVVVVGGGGLFLDEAKARPKDIISFSLDYNKQKLSTDKQSVIKPHFTRHAGRPADSVTTWQEPTTPLRGFHWLYVVYMTHPFPQEKSSEWRYALHLYSTPRLLGGWMMWPDINRWV